MVMENSFCEKPVRCDSRRLSDYLRLDGKRKVHSLVDKVYQQLISLVGLIPSIRAAKAYS